MNIKIFKPTLMYRYQTKDDWKREEVLSDSKWQYFRVEKYHKLYEVSTMNQISASRAATSSKFT